jgi:N6-adenosine-specific RNA methylase IME4
VGDSVVVLRSREAILKYATIVADPPWPMRWSGGGSTRVNGRGERHTNHRFRQPELDYPTMAIDDICALPVGSFANENAHLYLWIPDAFLIDGVARAVIDAWGFKPGRLLVWKKRGFGLGAFPRPQHEAVVVCKRGSLPFARRDVGSVQEWGVTYEVQSASGRANRVHSRKPDAFLDLVESASPGPYLELFARRKRLGWHAWGNEVNSDVELIA